MDESSEIGEIIDQARSLAIRYYKLTGRPLGITGEIGEYEAARLLRLSMAPVRECGFDATDKDGRRIQIKTRSLYLANKRIGSQRVGAIDLNSPWDAVFLVLLDDRLQPFAIYESGREAVRAALLAPGSKARNERGAMSISKFRSIGSQVWAKQTSAAPDTHSPQ